MAVNHLPKKRSAERCSIEVRCSHYLPIYCYWVCVPPSPSGHIILLQGKDVGTHGIEAVQSLSGFGYTKPRAPALRGSLHVSPKR